ncbi:glycerol-3-phosphate dehydrogenase [Sphingomonas flavalba]|uniref:glycerol-3-phosphate dehydrogenase n=1 Tax=Sphingomonas flavalba TaxID=2559804 RepID=UPI00109DC626|nr:glycerol-3-phosphate dehydrogenase [Sphingomonas flavalba]
MIHDLLIVGGGINGAAIAREAALNGLSVLLVEKDDLAAATSSASTKLIHGGLRYLEYYDFKLVREALIERERLLKAAPHLIHPLRFVLPHEHAIRPWWMVRLGLILYDHLAGRISLPRSRGLRAGDALYRAPLKDGRRGFVYSDARVDDSRLVILNARDAADHGATILTRIALIAAVRDGAVWRATLSDGRTATARAIVNAAGPWVAPVNAQIGVASRAGARLIKGSHIIVHQLFAGDHAYILQQPDRRIVFAIPYLDGLTLVGTTDVPVDRAEDACIDAVEVAYLLDAINRHFTRRTGRQDIVATYSGIRSLYDDGASEARQVTRDYVLELDDGGNADAPPLLSIFGGKITTGRRLAEDALAKLAPRLGITPAKVTRNRPLPGGEIADFDTFVAGAIARWPFLGAARARRMAGAYGVLLATLLDGVTDESGLGEDFGHGLTACEVAWLADREWARTAEDILWRRTRIGLSAPAGMAERLTAFLAARGR